MGKKLRKPVTPSSPTLPPEELDLPERWSAQRKMELVLRLLRGEALDAVSRETQVPAHLLESWQRRFLDGGQRALRTRPKRYRRVFVVPRPGDLVQLDVKFVPYLVEGHRLYQYTAIDCCTRVRLVSFRDELSIAAAKAFAQSVLSTFPFRVRCIQTDNDAIFTHWYTAGPKTPLDRPVKRHPFTAMCAQFGARHRLIPPRTPRLNGRVERSHQTDEHEFYQLRRYATRAELQPAFARWLWHYNHTRLHTGAGTGGRTPLQVFRTFAETADLWSLPCRCA
jgi:transposase InsO family protein